MYKTEPANLSGRHDTAMPLSAAALDPARLDAIHNDFIPHPAQFPIRYRRHHQLPWQRAARSVGDSDIGVRFHSTKHVAPGTVIDIEIPLRGTTQRFSGRVVMVQEVTDGFLIGLWLETAQDASRARLVERICYQECRLQSHQFLAV
jgi:hypothetical protein